jgi:hypothetical protein
MADKKIRYGAGGVPYVEKTEDKKSELIQEILEVNPEVEEDVATEEAPKKEDITKDKKDQEDE